MMYYRIVKYIVSFLIIVFVIPSFAENQYVRTSWGEYGFNISFVVEGLTSESLNPVDTHKSISHEIKGNKILFKLYTISHDSIEKNLKEDIFKKFDATGNFEVVWRQKVTKI